MLASALIFLVNTVLDFFTGALLLRFFMQWARAAQRNPVSDFVNALTNWLVRPARRLIPGMWGLDLASLVLAWLVQVLEIFFVLELRGYQLGPAAGQALAAIALLAVLALVRMSLYILIVVLIVQAVLSWVNPYSPMAPMLNALSRPFVKPFQRMIPPVANVDLSPLFVIIVCQLILILLANVF